MNISMEVFVINYSDADEEDDCSEDLRYYVYTWGFDAA